MIDVDDLPILFSEWRERYEPRDLRMMRMDKVLQGDTTVFDPDEEAVDIRSPNMIQVALEDTAEAASARPTVLVRPSKPGAEARQAASTQEKICVGYLEAADVDRLIHETNLDTFGFGLSAWMIWPDFEQGIPVIERRDPRQCYPNPGYRIGHRVQSVIFARQIYASSLPDQHKFLVTEKLNSLATTGRSLYDENLQVTIVEYVDENEIVSAALLNTSNNRYMVGSNDVEVSYVPVLLNRWTHNLGVCPVVIPDRVTTDGEFRGQFDQVIGILEAHMRLMGLVLDYADQAVYSDIWVKDLIGEMPYGGGAYIELGPAGQIGRVPPAVSSLDVQRDLQRLEDALHLGGRWPKTRPGEVDQAIASAKFVEATAGIMNTAIRTQHQVLVRALERALTICLVMDTKLLAGVKTMSGVLRNQQFLEEYDTADIDLKARVNVDYGVGFGRDPAQSAVLGIQYGQSGLMSKQTVMESIEGLTDITGEMIRMDI